MNKKLGLAVAGALLAAASSANAGITIPAGDWTVDLGGNVNAYYTHTNFSGALSKTSTNEIGTGLLPAALGIGAKTRQNDLDIAVQFTFFTGTSSGPAASSALGGFNSNGANGGGGANTLNIRQAYMTFGDASWGTIKGGRDLGVYGSDAILSDMTLLGVGNGAGGSGSSTLGRIGSGYVYADWVGQFSYTSPNFNGFQVTGAVREPWTNGADTTNSNVGWEGKATYDFAANDVTGRVWVGGITQKHDASGLTPGYTSKGWDVGAKASYAGAQLVGYYYGGSGLAGPSTVLNGVPFLGGTDADVSGGYVQATFVIPGVGTKVGASWGESMVAGTTAGSAEFKSESWIIGAYHPLTKSLNLVAEYTDNKQDNLLNVNGANGKARTAALGAILFF